MKELLKKDSSDEDDIIESNDMDDFSDMSQSTEKKPFKSPERKSQDKIKISLEISSKQSVTISQSEIPIDSSKKQINLDSQANDVQGENKTQSLTNQPQKTQVKEILNKPSATLQSSESETKQFQKQVNFEKSSSETADKKSVSLNHQLTAAAKPKKVLEQKKQQEEYKLSITQQLLLLEKEIKNVKNEKEYRYQKLKQYCELCQEEGKRLAHSQDEAEQRKAVHLQQQCVNLITNCVDAKNPLYDLLYVAQNNLAHFFNQLGNIEESLKFMLKAYINLNKLTKKNDAGTSTFLPEICLNICNAYIYVDKLSEARQFADYSIKSSQKCIEHLQKKINDVSDPEKLKIEQLIETQLSLNIQSYQTKAKVFLKLNLFTEAITEYKQAKDIVERSYGTNHQLFKELANLVSETNVKLKSVSYSNSEPKARSPQSLGRRPQTAIKRQDKANTSIKSVTSKMVNTMSPPSGKHNSTKDISGDDNYDSEVVQRMDGTIDIVSESSAFKIKKLEKCPSRQKRNRGGSRSGCRSFSKRHRSASSATRDLKIKTNDNRRYQPMIPINNHPQRVMMNPFIQQVQPPFNAGTPHLGHNKYNHLQYMTKNNDMWKFNHLYTPNMLGFLGYHSFNSERPKSFYQTNLRLLPHDERPKIIKKVTVIKDVVTPAADSFSVNEIKQLTDEIKIQVNHQQKTQVVSDNLNTRFFDDLLSQLTLQQSEEKKHLAQALNDQKIIIERQLYERQVAKSEREVLIQKIDDLKFIQISPITKKSQKFVNREPFALMPPVHPIYGPTTWDEESKKWKYPYLQQFIDAGIKLPVGKIQEKVEIVEQYQPLPHTRDFSSQKFPDPKKKPKMIIRKTQTDPEPEIETFDKKLQSETVDQVAIGIQLNPGDIPKPPRKPWARKQDLFTKIQAVIKIQNFYRRLYLKRKERDFLKSSILCVRKRNLIKHLNQVEILSVYFCKNADGRATSIKFTIYNCTNKSYVYKGTFNKLKYLQEFDAKILCTLSSPSLELIEFELSPFQKHLLVLKSIINLERANQKKITREIILTKEKIVLPEKKAKIIYKNRVEKPKQEISIQVDDGLLWKLINDDGTVFNEEEKEEDNHIWVAACKIQRFFKIIVAQKKFIEQTQQKVRQVQMEIKRKEDYQDFTIQLCLYDYSQTLFKLIKSFSKKYKDKIYFGEKNDFGYKINKKADENEFLEIIKRASKNVSNKYHNGDNDDENFEEEEEKQELQKKENKENKENERIYKFYQLEVFDRQPTWFQPMPIHATIYPDLRLPYYDYELENYLQKAVCFNYSDGQVKALKLIRLKKKEPLRIVRCKEIAQFKLVQYPGYICKIIKRRRIHPDNLKMISDYKIMVQQTHHFKSWDYICVRKLPCPFDDLEDVINLNLIIRFNKRVTYSTKELIKDQREEKTVINISPILYLILQVRKKSIYSQKYYDLSSPRFDVQFFGQFYISQNSENQEKRWPSEQEIKSKIFSDPLYEIFIQKLVPIENNFLPYKYQSKAYLEWKNKRREKKKRNNKYAKNISDSSSESDEKPQETSENYYWDISELASMQLDEVTGRQQYLQITVSRVDWKQEKDSFIMPLKNLPNDIDFMPSKDLMFQWIGENFKLKQKIRDQSYPFELSSGIEIILDDDRYKSDKNYVKTLVALKQKEKFLSQDISRLLERNFVNTVYCVQRDKNEDKGEPDQPQKYFHVIESIDIDNPQIRDYRELSDLKGVRGPRLTQYLDQNFELQNVQGHLFQINFKENILDYVKRQKIKIDQPHESMEIKNMEEKIQKQKSDFQEIQGPLQEVLQKVEAVVQKVQPVFKKVEKVGAFAQFEVVIDKYKLKILLNKFQTKSNVIVHNICYEVNILKAKNDAFTFKIKNLPIGLQKNEDNQKKLQEVFQQRLKIVWDNDWRIQDAYIDNTIQKEQVIHRIVEVKQWHSYYEKIKDIKIVEKEVIVEKLVEKPVYIEKIIEIPVEVVKIVEKQVQVEKIIEKQVYIQQLIEKPKEVTEPEEKQKEMPVFIETNVVQIEEEKIVEEIKEPVKKTDWDEQQPPTGKLNCEVTGIFKIKGATMIYKIFSDNQKNYYFDCETEALNQKFNLYNCVIFGDNFEQQARDELKSSGNLNPTKKKMAEQLNEIFRPKFEQICKDQINEKIQPESWIPRVKELLKERFSQ